MRAPEEAQAKDVSAHRGVVAVPVGDATVDGVVEPAPTAEDAAVGPEDCANRVGYTPLASAVSMLVPPIKAPVIDPSLESVESARGRALLPHRVGLVGSVIIMPSDLVELSAP